MYSDILRFQFFRTFYQSRSYLEFRFSFVPRDLSEIRTDGTFHVNLVLRVTTRLFGERFGERVSWIRLYRFRHFVNPSFSRFSRLYIYIYINIWWLTFDVEEGSTGDTGNFDRVLSCVLHFGIHDDELVAIFLVLELVFRRREQFLLGEKMKKEDGDKIGWYTYMDWKKKNLRPFGRTISVCNSVSRNSPRTRPSCLCPPWRIDQPTVSGNFPASAK